MKFSPFASVCRSLLQVTLAALVCAGAQAQTYPVKPIHLVVGYTAGGGLDGVARLLAPRLSTLLGQQVLVENRTGASGLIAGEYVAKAPPDGYTLLLGESGLLIARYLQPQMPFDPIKAFAPVAGLFVSPIMIVAGNDFPAKTPKELVALLKSRPGKYSFATVGVGSVQFLGFEMLKAQAGAFVLHIPYRGAAQIVPDVIGGQVPMGVVTIGAGMTQAKAGKLRAVALLSPVKPRAFCRCLMPCPDSMSPRARRCWRLQERLQRSLNASQMQCRRFLQALS